MVLGGGAVSYERGTPVGVGLTDMERGSTTRGHPQARSTSDQGEEQPFYRNVKRFRDGLVFKARRLCVSLNSRREREEEKHLTDMERGSPTWERPEARGT